MREPPQALRAVFGEEALAIAAGHGIDAANAAQAEAAGVAYLEAPKPRRETGAIWPKTWRRRMLGA